MTKLVLHEQSTGAIFYGNLLALGCRSNTMPFKVVHVIGQHARLAETLTGKQRGGNEISILIVLLSVVFYPLTGIRAFSRLSGDTAVNSSLAVGNITENGRHGSVKGSVMVRRGGVRNSSCVTFTLQGTVAFVGLSYCSCSAFHARAHARVRTPTHPSASVIVDGRREG